MRIDIKSRLDSVWHANKLSVLRGEVGYRLAHELLEDFEITDKTTYASLWIEASTTMLLMAERCLGDLFNSFKATFDRPPTAKEIEKYIALNSLIQHKQLAACLSDFPALEATE